jgi:hypothetical protein
MQICLYDCLKATGIRPRKASMRAVFMLMTSFHLLRAIGVCGFGFSTVVQVNSAGIIVVMIAAQ